MLLLDAGHTWAAIRDKLDCNDAFIDRWSKRFRKSGWQGCSAGTLGKSQHADTCAGGAHSGMELKRRRRTERRSGSTRRLEDH